MGGRHKRIKIHLLLVNKNSIFYPTVNFIKLILKYIKKHMTVFFKIIEKIESFQYLQSIQDEKFKIKRKNDEDMFGFLLQVYICTQMCISVQGTTDNLTLCIQLCI